jgi:hypothetical protein
MSKRDLLLLLGLTLLFTALGSVKPMHMDETANYYYAVHIAEHPLDPYGFIVFWYDEPMAANHVLTPPVMVYWWSVAVRLFGDDQPVLWKLWLWPFNLAFVFSVHALYRRFAPKKGTGPLPSQVPSPFSGGLEMGLTWMTVLSPAFLPSMNLMPDIPALSLSLLALVLFLRAEEGGGLGLAALSGLVAGLAMQTKYTAFVTPAVLMTRAVLIGRTRLGVVAVCLSAAVFIGWEGLIAWKYGDSHFLYQLHDSGQSLSEKIFLALPLLSLLGGVAPFVGMLGLIALAVRRWVIELAGAAVVSTCLLLACVGVTYTADVTPSPWLPLVVGSHPEKFTLAFVVFGLLGLMVCAVTWRLVAISWPSEKEDWFLVLWLAAEVAGYFALSPFPAVRRVLGVVLVLTLLAGRQACRTGLAGDRAALFYGVVVCNILLGLFYWGVDVYDARATGLAANTVAREIQDRGGGGEVWYIGHWGFQYYAEQAGMKPVAPGQSRLRPGDWLVLPAPPIERQEIEVAADQSVPVFIVNVDDPLPLRAMGNYYGGTVPIEHRTGPRVAVEVRRVTAAWVPVAASPQP